MVPSTGGFGTKDTTIYNHLHQYSLPTDFLGEIGIQLDDEQKVLADQDTRVFAMHNDPNPDGVASISWNGGDVNDNVKQIMCVFSGKPVRSCKTTEDCEAHEVCFTNESTGACRRNKTTLYEDMSVNYVDSKNNIISMSCSAEKPDTDGPGKAYDRCCTFKPNPTSAVLLESFIPGSDL